MKKILSLLVFSAFFCGSLAFAGDSASNRKDQTVRLGMKSGIHLMYATSSPFVLEMPGEDWTFGLTYGSGKYNYSYTDYNSATSTYSIKSQSINFSTTEVTGRYYIGNSFNIPFGYANYKISYPDWVYSGVTYDIDYEISQLNYGIGNEWTYDWGGYLGIDWYQGGSKLSDKATVKLKSGTETATTLAQATVTSTDVKAFAGVFVMTFGFGF
ncbi:MAG: hypothetical protein H8E38_06315 [SAR324 cluster bacterium]|nr:hypothetical protein [SAR324 cluster bacterium]MBL7034950.1 hypothetical protein [SAR324 cluster bacterium]